MKIPSRIANVFLPEPEMIQLLIVIEERLKSSDNQFLRNAKSLLLSAEQIEHETTNSQYFVRDNSILFKREALFLTGIPLLATFFIGELICELDLPNGFKIKKRYSESKRCWEVFCEYIYGPTDSVHSVTLEEVRKLSPIIKNRVEAMVMNIVNDYLKEEMNQC